MEFLLPADTREPYVVLFLDSLFSDTAGDTNNAMYSNRNTFFRPRPPTHPEGILERLWALKSERSLEKIVGREGYREVLNEVAGVQA